VDFDDIFGRFGHGPSRNGFDFGDDLDLIVDSGLIDLTLWIA